MHIHSSDTHWSGEVFQLKAVPLLKPKSMDAIFVILFNYIVQNVENFCAMLAIFFKIYWTNFWLALDQTAGGVIWIISRRRLLCATSKRITYLTVVFSFGIRRRSAKRSAWPAKQTQHVVKSLVKSWNQSFLSIFLNWKLVK